MGPTSAPDERLASVFLQPRGPGSRSPLSGRTARLYVAEPGIEWHGLPAHCDHWHPISPRLTRWTQIGGRAGVGGVARLEFMQGRGEGRARDGTHHPHRYHHPRQSSAAREDGGRVVCARL